jgi:bla regulator protein BlaR1
LYVKQEAFMPERIIAALLASLLWVFTLPASAQPLDRLAGAYRVSVIQVFHIRVEGDSLMLRPSSGPQMGLLATGPNRFTETMSGAQFVFSDDATTVTATNGDHVLIGKRIGEDAARALEDAVAARVKAGAPSPGTEDSVRRYIVSLENGAPNYDEIEPRVADENRRRLQSQMAEIQKLGLFKSLTFTTVTSNGMDVYDAKFEHGEVMVGLAPLDADGKVEFRSWSPRQ